MKNFLLALGLLSFIIGCSDKPCYEETDFFLNVSFYTIDSTGQPTDTVFDTLYVAGVGSPYQLEYTGSTYEFVLDLNNDSTQFYFDFNEEGNSDQVVFSYKRNPFLVSHECGFAMFFDSLQVESFTTNFIDSIEIISNTIDDSEQDNVKIYL